MHYCRRTNLINFHPHGDTTNTNSHNNNNNNNGNKMQKMKYTVEIPAELVENWKLNHTNCKSSGSEYTNRNYNGFDTAGMNTTTIYDDENKNNTNIELWVSQK